MITVYLCGGINKLSDADAKDWREEAKAALVGMRTLDPMRRDYRGKEADSVNEIVLGDLADIGLSDSILVNASRPSWGTAMEIYHAAMLGKRVVAFGAGDKPSPWLVYHKGMALDCGAYTELRSGIPVDLHAYADFVAQHGAFYDWCASVDSIRGGVAENLRNWAFLNDRGLRTMPTYHQGEPVSVLRDYCAHSDRVGLGFQRPITGELAFLDEAFSVIPSTVKVHGWAMTNYTARYPFASVDSTTWLRELLALRVFRPGFQQGFGLDHLTDGELIEIIQKKYDRLPRTEMWTGVRTPQQATLFAKGAA